MTGTTDARCNVAVCEGCWRYERMANSPAGGPPVTSPLSLHWCSSGILNIGFLDRAGFETLVCPSNCDRIENQRLHTMLREL